LGIAEEECDETIYWMDMLIELKLIREHRTRELRGEAEELLAIIVSSIKTPRRNKG
jgi:four helix bundle protein